MPKVSSYVHRRLHTGSRAHEFGTTGAPSNDVAG
jgi:hypothetical protein